MVGGLFAAFFLLVALLRFAAEGPAPITPSGILLGYRDLRAEIPAVGWLVNGSIVLVLLRYGLNLFGTPFDISKVAAEFRQFLSGEFRVGSVNALGLILGIFLLVIAIAPNEALELVTQRKYDIPEGVQILLIGGIAIFMSLSIVVVGVVESFRPRGP